MAEPTTIPSEKPDVVRDEGTIGDIDDVVKVDGYDSYGLVKSRYDELSIPQTLWVFKRVVLVSLAVYTGYVCEGFEVSEGPTSCRSPIAAGTQRWSAVACNGRGLTQHSSALEAVSSRTLGSSSSSVQSRVQA